MHITELTIENIKRINAVHIKPDGAIIEITGRNGQGKSSVLDSIAYGLGGKDEIPSKPIREGADEAHIIIELDDKIVKRRWTKGGNTMLTVESKDGAKFPSPQALLDSLTGDLTFDPLAFNRMSPTDQVATLKDVAGLDFAELDRRRQDAFEERTIVNRALKDANGALANTPAVEAPAEAVSMAELIEQQNEANNHQRMNDDLRRDHETSVGVICTLSKSRDATASANNDGVENCSQRIASLEQQIQDTKLERTRWIESHSAKIGEIDVKIKAARTSSAALASQVNQIQDPDLDAIAAKIAGAEESNEKFRAARQRAELVGLRDEHASKSKALTKKIDKIDATKVQTVRDANLPIEGLGFDEDGISFEGLPFEQASSAQQLRVSVAMGIALNPKLRVMLIRDGSLLDKDSLVLLGELAEANDTQVWIERVSDGENVGIVIEDGYVRGAEAESQKPEAVAPAFRPMM